MILILVFSNSLWAQSEPQSSSPLLKPKSVLEKQASPTTEDNTKSYLRYQDLSSSEREILMRGEISSGRYILGGIVGTYPLGFGLGHAIQGRYTEKGWIFTVGELGSIGVLYMGVGRCVNSWDWDSKCDSSLIMAGLIGFVFFRIWEIVDVWATPPMINQKYRNLKKMMGPNHSDFETLLLPEKDGGRLALQWRF